MKKVVSIIIIILSAHFAFAQTERKQTEEYCMLVYDYRASGKLTQDIGLVKPDGKIEITKIETGTSPFSEIIKMLNKLNSEGWVVTNSENMNFSKSGNTTGASLCYLLRRVL